MRRAARWVRVLLLVAYAATLIVAGLWLHPIKALGIENDDYVGMARSLLAGTLPRDPFRPMLYPLASAAVGWLVGDCFVGAKIVSALAATTLVWSTYALTARCCAPRHAMLAAVLVAGNGHVVTFGMQAGTDMLFTALAAVALVAVVCAWERPSGGRLAVLGVALGIAYFARYQAGLLLLPAALVCWGAAPPVSWRQRATRGVCVLAAGAVALVPHGLLSRAVFGSWLHDENWRTVELKYAHDFVFSRMPSTDAGSVAAVLLRDPGTVVRRALADLWTCLGDALPVMVQGCGPVTLVGIAFAAAAAFGLATAVRQRLFPLALPLTYTIAAVVAACVLFVPVPRVLLGTVPLAAAGLAVAALGVQARSAFVGCMLVAALVGSGSFHTVRAVHQLQDAEPWREVRAAQRLQMECAAPFRLLATYEYLEHILRPVECVWLQPPYTADEIAAWSEQVVRDADRLGAAFVLVGRVSCGANVFAMLAASTHPRLVVRERDEDVLLWEVRGVQLDWVATTVVEAGAGGDCVVRVTLREDVPVDDVGLVGVRVRAGPGEPAHITLPPVAARTFEARLPFGRGAAGSAGTWTVEPIVVSKRGRFGGGAPFVWRGP